MVIIMPPLLVLSMEKESLIGATIMTLLKVALIGIMSLQDHGLESVSHTSQMNSEKEIKGTSNL
jgi:hypothetical protein